ncbi:hypothetical protein QBC39DRAFT_343650 [Podospora conica]|nr:hypothetical protein QBC39DRAFT_343650 [Schizothecium conicum]
MSQPSPCQQAGRLSLAWRAGSRLAGQGGQDAALSDVPEMPSAERKRLNCSRAHDHSSQRGAGGRWHVVKKTEPLSPENPGSRPKPPEPSDMPGPLERCRTKVWKRRPSPPLRPAREATPETPSCPARSTRSRQASRRGKPKTFFLLAVPLFFLGSVCLWSIPRSLPPQPSSNTSDPPPLRLAPSGIQTCPYTAKEKKPSGVPGR